MSSNYQNRDTLFISHALPEDNEFAKWLAARLRNEGYKVWCELDEIYGGDHFWDKISSVIRDEAIKFIFVGSHASVIKRGVRKEWDFACSIQDEYNLEHFIIPINLDGINSNALIGLTGLAMMHFHNSWAYGLKMLIRCLQRDHVPQQSESPLSASHLLINPHTLNGGIIEQEEIFYSNWLDLPHLPDFYYIYDFVNKKLAEQQIKQIRDIGQYPAVQHDRYIITFSEILPELKRNLTNTALFDHEITLSDSRIFINIKDILNRSFQSTEFPTTADRSNLLVQLLRQAFHDFLVRHSLKTYCLANDRLCYYYTRSLEDKADVTIKFTYKQKPKSKQLTGKYLEDVWHYGVSFNPRLRPYPCFSFKGHILYCFRLRMSYYFALVR